MLLPPRIEYYGDIDKGQSLKGMALSFYNFVCQGMGEAWTVTREKRVDDDGIQIQAQVTKTAYGDYTAVLKIYVRPVTGGDEEIFLFCTSFTATNDAGTQVYKNPYPPITQGGLILADNNPDSLTLPTPDYKARAGTPGTGYWANTKEDDCVSWEYVDVEISGSPKKCGKISIHGAETSNAWGLFLEPFCCALLPNKKIAIIYYDRVNLSGTGSTLYLAKFNYSIDAATGIVSLSRTHLFTLSSYPGYVASFLPVGILEDGITIIYSARVADTSLGFTIFMTAAKYLTMDESYSSVVNDNLLYVGVPQQHTIIGSLDVRGDTFGFLVRYLDDRQYSKRFDVTNGLITTLEATASQFSMITAPKLNERIYFDGVSIKSKRMGTLIGIDDIADYHYSYTKDNMLISIESPDGTIKNGVLIDYKGKKIHVIDYKPEKISITKLPKATP